jgi:hypothetical protein
MAEIPDEAVRAAMACRADLLADRPDPMVLSDETLTRKMLEAAAPLLAEEAPKVRERARYWSEAVTPLRDLAEEIGLLLTSEPSGRDSQALREMLEEARDTITRCVG